MDTERYPKRRIRPVVLLDAEQDLGKLLLLSDGLGDVFGDVVYEVF